MLIIKKKQYGFSMIEVLASLVVISVGLLGMSGLQIASVKSTNNAHSRNIATMLSMELSERMRANPLGVEAGNYGDTAVVCADGIPNQCDTTTFCNTSEIAANDIFEIVCGASVESGIENQLVSGSLEVNCDPSCDTLGVEHEIVVSWSASQVHEDQDATLSSNEIRTVVIP